MRLPAAMFISAPLESTVDEDVCVVLVLGGAEPESPPDSLLMR